MTRRPFADVLVHPAAVTSLVILVVNDHVLKRAHPGWITGKLSDFAGMLLTPLVLVALVDAAAGERARSTRFAQRSAWASAFLVAALFAAAKTWPPATQAYELGLAALRAPLRAALSLALGVPHFGEQVRLVRDPTDLLALPVAFWAAHLGAGRHRRWTTPATVASEAGAPRRPDAG
jgi:hypothetical protein